MPNLMPQSIRYVISATFALLLALTVACGTPDATTENTPPSTAETTVPQQASQATGTSEQPADPANVGERPILNAGVIWLDSPLDPVESGWVANQSGMSENLFRLSATILSPEPWLATAAAQIDPLTWEITLRPDVRFHNGNTMDAQAVKASLERTIRLSPASAENLGIDTVSVKDGQTITVTTTDPRPTLPGLLTSPATAITDAAAADAAGEGNFIDAGALTGPYIPTEYVQKERLSSVANDDYWGGTPPLAGIEHLAIPDTNSRELALQAGDIDVAINISPNGAQAINSQPGMHSLTAGIGTSVVMWWVNFERGTLSDPLVLRAVAHAIDRKSIADLVAPEGTGSFAELLLPEALVSCPGVTAPGYDPDQARILLAQAGYADSNGDGVLDKDGQPLEIVIGGYPERFRLPIMAEAAQAMLVDVGIQAEVRITEWSVVNEPEWDLFGWFNNVVETGDPVVNVSKYAGIRADASGSGANNYGHYDNSRLADIVARAGNVSDIEQRKGIACEALAVVAEESAFLPVAHVYMVYGVNERVTGFEPHPASLYFFDHRIGLAQ